jgi:hypothetical protein
MIPVVAVMMSTAAKPTSAWSLQRNERMTHLSCRCSCVIISWTSASAAEALSALQCPGASLQTFRRTCIPAQQVPHKQIRLYQHRPCCYKLECFASKPCKCMITTQSTLAEDICHADALTCRPPAQLQCSAPDRWVTQATALVHLPAIAEEADKRL